MVLSPITTIKAFLEDIEDRIAIIKGDEWDKQIAADTEAGKLDFLIAEALDAEAKGTLRYL